MLDILYDIHQNSKIGEADAKASAGLRQAERTGERVADLEERLDKMALLNLALWGLLQEKLGVTDEELMRRVEELDLRDGQLDGRIARAPIDCPDCHRPLHQRHRRCLYCGFELRQNGFEAVTR
ncbi:MAG: hypothetical protein KY445_13360 [Armatimonadetes bacterium]|nr:hypothetical protein [Armatimonadota bacterium]